MNCLVKSVFIYGSLKSQFERNLPTDAYESFVATKGHVLAYGGWRITQSDYNHRDFGVCRRSHTGP